MSSEGLGQPSRDGDLTAARARGRPARISRDAIVAVARTIPPEALTMQRVADALGVNPKALNYHVGDRDGLRQLVVLDVFDTELRRADLRGGGDWRDVVGAYVRALHDATIKLGVLATSIQLPVGQGLGMLRPVESLLQALVGAGLDVDEAGRALFLITEVAYSVARDALRMADDPVHPDVPGLASALKEAAEPDFPVLRQVVATRRNGDSDRNQLDFSVEFVVAGLERLVAKARRSI